MHQSAVESAAESTRVRLISLCRPSQPDLVPRKETHGTRDEWFKRADTRPTVVRHPYISGFLAKRSTTCCARRGEAQQHGQAVSR